jgi:hypothetical protein
MSYPTDKWFRHLREQEEPEEISEEVEELAIHLAKVLKLLIFMT